jgi:ferredoxin
MAVIKVLNKDGNLINEIEVNVENTFNKILKRKKSILDILLDNKIDIYYGCMGGSCSACVCEIIEGKEHIDKEGLHEQVYKGIGEKDFLSCIATIKDESIENGIIEIKTKL